MEQLLPKLRKNTKGQPVLVGTTSIDKNEIISEYLKEERFHNVLNAKNHEKEASIISEAGEVGAVTVATNMAGRGVDIVLGGARPTGKKDLKRWGELHEKVVRREGFMLSEPRDMNPEELIIN